MTQEQTNRIRRFIKATEDLYLQLKQWQKQLRAKDQRNKRLPIRKTSDVIEISLGSFVDPVFAGSWSSSRYEVLVLAEDAGRPLEELSADREREFIERLKRAESRVWRSRLIPSSFATLVDEMRVREKALLGELRLLADDSVPTKSSETESSKVGEMLREEELEFLQRLSKSAIERKASQWAAEYRCSDRTIRNRRDVLLSHRLVKKNGTLIVVTQFGREFLKRHATG